MGCQDTETEHARDRALGTLQEKISPYLTSVLAEEEPAEEIYGWSHCTNRDFEHAINPFTRTFRQTQDLAKIVSKMYRSDDSYQGSNPAELAGGQYAQACESLRSAVLDGQENIRSLERIERRVNGYLAMLHSLTSFLQTYHQSRPREQDMSDLRYLAGYRVHVRAGNEYVLGDEEREFSPQFFLSVDEQTENYNRLRVLATELNTQNLDQQRFQDNLRRLYNEMVSGALFEIRDANTLTSSRQGVQRYQDDNLVFSAADIRFYLGKDINWRSMECRPETGCFIEARRSWFDL